MAAYRREVDAIAGHFQGYQIEHIDHKKNEVADALSRLGSQRKPVPPNTFLDVRDSQVFLCRQLNRRVIQDVQESIRRHRFSLRAQPA